MSPSDYARTVRIGLTRNPAETRYLKGDLYAFKIGPYIKVGIAQNGWRTRIDQIRGHSPFKVRRVCSRSVPLAGLRYGEKYAHEQLAAFHHHREWFLVDTKTVAAVLKVAATVAEEVALRIELEYAQAQDKRKKDTNLTPVHVAVKNPKLDARGKLILYPRVREEAES